MRNLFSRALAKFLSSWTKQIWELLTSKIERVKACAYEVGKVTQDWLPFTDYLITDWLAEGACPGTVGGVLAREMDTPPPTTCLLESEIHRNTLGPERKTGTTGDLRDDQVDALQTGAPFCASKTNREGWTGSLSTITTQPWVLSSPESLFKEA